MSGGVVSDVDWAQFARVLTLRDYNTRIPLLGTTLLGVCAGVVGVFMLLRRRSLVGDVVGHSSLPGVALAFLVLEARAPGSGRSLTGLLTGAFLSGMLGVACVTAIRTWTRIKDDAAQAIVLSLFFGLGISLFTVIQSIPGGNAAGLNQFIFGKAASLLAEDVKLIGIATAVTLVLCFALFKEFSLLCFDEDFARAQGWPATPLDLLLMALVAVVTVIGLQSVGLLLVVALLIIPPAAARFWTNRLGTLVLLAGLLGGLTSAVGVACSALLSRLAAGPTIVLSGSLAFLISLLLGTHGGVLHRLWRALQLKRRVGRLDLLRATYEILEARTEAFEAQHGTATGPASVTDSAVPSLDWTTALVTREELREARSWSPHELETILKRVAREDLIQTSPRGIHLTTDGILESQRIVRNHRLWEMYLMTYADIAPSHVDRDADQIEHVLDPELIDELERLLGEREAAAVPPSPHALGGGVAGQRDTGTAGRGDGISRDQ